MKQVKPSKRKVPTIKALTIRQPWAELILRGRKPFELRTWRTKYRGPLVIHAAAKVDAWDARHFGLNPENLVGRVCGLRHPEGCTTLHERRRTAAQKEAGRLRLVSGKSLLGVGEAASHYAR
jgi:hypothetical protein